MKQIRLLAYAILSTFVFTSPLSARLFQPLSPQQLNDKSDLVIIATPASTGDSGEKLFNFNGFVGQTAVGVETKFTVLTVLKGDSTTRLVVLHHYRVDGISAPNGPNFVSFDPAKNQQFLLILVREPDGRYAPTSGQIDPGFENGVYALTTPRRG